MTVPDVPVPQTPEEALSRSRRRLEAVQAQGAEVSRIASALRTINEANHFAERLELTMRRASR